MAKVGKLFWEQVLGYLETKELQEIAIQHSKPIAVTKRSDGKTYIHYHIQPECFDYIYEHGDEICQAFADALGASCTTLFKERHLILYGTPPVPKPPEAVQAPPRPPVAPPKPTTDLELPYRYYGKQITKEMFFSAVCEPTPPPSTSHLGLYFKELMENRELYASLEERFKEYGWQVVPQQYLTADLG